MAVDPFVLDFFSKTFFPYAYRRREKLMGSRKLAHYTSAETALSIVQHEAIWLRRATAMNDFREIDFGLDEVLKVLRSGRGDGYIEAINSILPGIADDVEAIIQSIYERARSETYISCYSEHLPEEDGIGRLSMWRAYGGETGVALIINPLVLSLNVPVGLISVPVLYPGSETLADQMHEQAVSLLKARAEILKFDNNLISKLLYQCWRMSLLSIKHRGFEEEREWRLIYEPEADVDSRIKSQIRSVRGTPQVVKIFNFKNDKPGTAINLDFHSIIEQIIIGPTHHPSVMRDAFIELLASKGVQNPEARVVNSDIPLRYQ